MKTKEITGNEKSQYMVFMEKREELIKQGSSLSEATDKAYRIAYVEEEKIDPMSYADR